jgi:outer membrane protein
LEKVEGLWRNVSASSRILEHGEESEEKDRPWPMKSSIFAAGAAIFLFGLGTAPVVSAQPLLTLDEALGEAHRANARLPVAAFDTLIAGASIEEARGALGPSLGLDGDLHGGAPSAYASGDARLQAVLDLPLYDGGRRRADLHTARAGLDLSGARYRSAVAEVDLEVRTRFAEILGLDRELGLVRRGRERLERYVDLIQARKGSGEPVAADLLKAQVRLDSEAADLEDLGERRDLARLEFNDLLGRDPADSLELAPLPRPSPPVPGGANPWENTPDLLAARLVHRVELSRIDAVRAERRPHLDLSANAGTEPILGSSDPAPLNTGTGSGAEVTLSFSWPLWDTGAYRGRLRQATLGARQAEAETVAVRRSVHLGWSEARTDMVHLYRQIETWESAVPLAEEAYLQAESSYRGGGASALDVLDAFDQWIQAGRSAAQAEVAYRGAEARALRWGTP